MPGSLATFTDPASLEMLDSEIRTPTIDFSPDLEIGETLTGTPLVTLTDEASGADYAAGLSGAAAIVGGDSVTQTLDNLQAGHIYRLVITATVSATKVISAQLRVLCVGL